MGLQRVGHVRVTKHTHTQHTYTEIHAYIYTNTHRYIYMCVYIYMYICINGGSSRLPVPSPRGVRSPEVVLMLVWTLRAQPDWKCLGNCVDHTSEMSSLTKGQGTWHMHSSTSLGENNHKSLPSARVCKAGSCRKLSEGDGCRSSLSGISTQGVWVDVNALC